MKRFNSHHSDVRIPPHPPPPPHTHTLRSPRAPLPYHHNPPPPPPPPSRHCCWCGGGGRREAVKKKLSCVNQTSSNHPPPPPKKKCLPHCSWQCCLLRWAKLHQITPPKKSVCLTVQDNVVCYDELNFIRSQVKKSASLCRWMFCESLHVASADKEKEKDKKKGRKKKLTEGPGKQLLKTVFYIVWSWWWWWWWWWRWWWWRWWWRWLWGEGSFLFFGCWCFSAYFLQSCADLFAQSDFPCCGGGEGGGGGGGREEELSMTCSARRRPRSRSERSEGCWTRAHSEHRFPAPSSKLCQIWLRHWRGTLYLRAAVHRRGQRSPKGLGTDWYDCGCNLAPKHARKHESHLPRVKKEFRLGSNDSGFIWAGGSNIVIKQTSDIIWVVCNKLSTVWAPTKDCSLADSFLEPMAQLNTAVVEGRMS